jgi:hypothetical protein
MRRGYSRDHRSDCKQVVLALIVSPEGFPLAYEVFDGHRTDVTPPWATSSSQSKPSTVRPSGYGSWTAGSSANPT